MGAARRTQRQGILTNPSAREARQGRAAERIRHGAIFSWVENRCAAAGETDQFLLTEIAGDAAIPLLTVRTACPLLGADRGSRRTCQPARTRRLPNAHSRLTDIASRTFELAATTRPGHPVTTAVRRDERAITILARHERGLPLLAVPTNA